MSTTPHFGDRVFCINAWGEEWETIARSEPRIDYDNAINRHYYLSVLVDHPGLGHPVNWPAENVRIAK